MFLVLVMELSTSLIWISIPFVIATAYFGTRNGYYDTDKYDGDGCAHDVKRWIFEILSQVKSQRKFY